MPSTGSGTRPQLEIEVTINVFVPSWLGVIDLTVTVVDFGIAP